jgi:uncharacterized membrane protein HdeD (DUF308 family)
MIDRVAQHWWLVALRGVVSILFGVVALFLPFATLAVLVIFFGAYMFVDGAFALFSAIRFRHEREKWVPLLIEGLVGLAVGAVAFAYPGITALAGLFTLAFWALVTGILEIVAGIRLRRDPAAAKTELMLILSGVLSIVLGIFFVAMPIAGLLASVWVIGTYAIVFGILMVGFGFRLRAIHNDTPTVGTRPLTR